MSGNSLVFSRKIIPSTGFYRCCAPRASAPVVVKSGVETIPKFRDRKKRYPKELVFMYFQSSLRARTAKTLICTKSGGLRRFQKEHQRVRKTALFAHFLHTFGTKSVVLLFLESAEPPLFVQINVFAVQALRLDWKYTKLA